MKYDNEKQQLLCSASQFKKWREKFEGEEEAKNVLYEGKNGVTVGFAITLSLSRIAWV